MKVMLDGGAGDLVFNAGTYIAQADSQRQNCAGLAGKPSARKRSGAHANRGAEWFATCASALHRVLQKTAPGTETTPARAKVRQLVTDQFGVCSAHQYRGALRENARDVFGNSIGRSGLERVRKIRPNLTAGRERFGRMAASAGASRCAILSQISASSIFVRACRTTTVARGGWPKISCARCMADSYRTRCVGARKAAYWLALTIDMFLESEAIPRRTELDMLANRWRLHRYRRRSAPRGAHSSLATIRAIHSSVVLSRWLERTAKRPVVNDQGFG